MSRSHRAIRWFAAQLPGAATLAMLAPVALADAADPATGTDGFDEIALLFLSVPGYVLLQLGLARWTSGGWRKAALVPALLMVPIIGFTVLAFAAQSNLWPLLLLFASPVACLYLIVFAIILVIARIARPA